MNGDKVAEASRITLYGSLVNILLSVGKLAAGIAYHSQALAADGLHSFSDLATDVMVLVGVRYWSAPPDKNHPYGHAKIEAIVTAVIGLLLALVGGGIAWNAVINLWNGTSSGTGLPALFIALASIVLKELLYQWTRRCGKRIGSAALTANAWHHRSDALSSIPVAASICVTCFFPSLAFLDSVGALLVSVFIVYSAWAIVKPTFYELTDANLVDTEAIRRICLSVSGADEVHAIRTRKYGNMLQVDLH